ncbi:lipoprotein [Winogradskyella sp. HB-48]
MKKIVYLLLLTVLLSACKMKNKQNLQL